jgi:hypothetical protein
MRTWNVDDVTIPLPFNIGARISPRKALYQTSDSLSPNGSSDIRKARVVPAGVHHRGVQQRHLRQRGHALQRSQFTNTRLIGRSVWNSKWKLVIPGTKLLHDPDEGLRRFINSVSDIKLHMVTYSYAGN